MNVSLWNQPQTTIGHLRARYTGPAESTERTTLRLRVERMLDNTDLRPPGLSSGAMLLVRRLHSPASVRVSALSQPTLLNWQTPLREQLAALYASAARPALGSVPLDARSVLFIDPAEMLACLTADLLDGRAQERWYWQQVLRGLSPTPGSALPELWSANAAYLPGVFAALGPSGALRAITHFSPHAIEQVIRSLHQSFDLSSWGLTAVVPAKPEVALVAEQNQEIDREDLNVSPAGGPLPPWEQWLPSTTLPALLPEARYLLGLGMALHHAPAFARSTRFNASVLRWLQSKRLRWSRASTHLHAFNRSASATQAGPQENALPLKDRAGEQDDSPLSEAVQERTQSKTATDEEASEQQAQIMPGAELLTVSDGYKNALDGSSPPEDAQDSLSSLMLDERSGEQEVLQTSEAMPPLTREAALQQADTTLPSQGVPSSLAATPLRPLTPDAPGASVSASNGTQEIQRSPKAREFIIGASRGLPADGVFTRLGGVLYLINVVTGLNLLHSREMDGILAEYIGGWAIIEALGRGLLALGKLHEHYVHDPVWHVLALLDGREAGTPVTMGGGVEEQIFRLPVASLQRYGSALLGAVQDGERLLLYDGMAGFLIADVPLHGRSFFEAAHAEVEAYREQGLEVQWTPGSPSILHSLFREDLYSIDGEERNPLASRNGLLSYMGEDILWWLRRILGFVYYLLAHSLGVPLDEPERLAELVLCRHGQLIVSRTHVDLHMSMEEIDIALRLAGLDRDPAWVPDLARIVYFHFD